MRGRNTCILRVTPKIKWDKDRGKEPQRPKSDFPWFWTDQHGVNLQVAGLPADAARTIVRASDPPKVFTAVHLAEDGSVIGVTAANNPREIRAGQALIKSRRPVDATALADPAVPLQRLIQRAS